MNYISTKLFEKTGGTIQSVARSLHFVLSVIKMTLGSCAQRRGSLGEQCPGCGSHLGTRRWTLSGVETGKRKRGKWLKVHLQCKSRKSTKRRQIWIYSLLWSKPTPPSVLMSPQGRGANACPSCSPPPSQSQGTRSSSLPPPPASSRTAQSPCFSGSLPSSEFLHQHPWYITFRSEVEPFVFNMM